MAANINVFSANTTFYVVTDRHRANEKKMFFNDAARALLWAILTDPSVRPIPLTKEENVAQVMATSLHERLVRKARFPLNSNYVIASFITPKELRYVNDYVTDEQFTEVEKAGRTATGFFRHALPSFVKAGFITMLPNGQINIDQTYENLANLQPEQMQTIESSTIRIVGPMPLSHQSDYSVDWEALWSLVIQLLAQNGDENLQAIAQGIARVLSDAKTIGQLITGQAPPGYDDCYDALVGPFNEPGNSCFMDSTLICLFGFKNSPFYQKLVVEDANTNTKFTVCSNDRDEDRATRLRIQSLLREDVAILMSGRKRFHCTNLRKLLGSQCRKWRVNARGERVTNDEDLSMGHHDPAELYNRLVEAIGYNPITIRTVVYRAADEQGTDEVILTETVDDVPMLPSLRAGDENLYAAAWPYSWQSDFENLVSDSSKGRPFVRTAREILRADVVIVHVDRSVAAGEIIEPPPQALSSTTFNPLLSLFGGEEEEFYVPPELQAEVFGTGEPFNPAKRDERQVNPRPVSVQPEMNINGTTYLLKGVVYSPFNGHYNALLHCGNRWFIYNDLDATRPISDAPVSEDEAAILIQTRGTLLFYYPTFQGRIAPLKPGAELSTQTTIQTPMQSLTLGGKK